MQKLNTLPDGSKFKASSRKTAAVYVVNTKQKAGVIVTSENSGKTYTMPLKKLVKPV